MKTLQSWTSGVWDALGERDQFNHNLCSRARAIRLRKLWVSCICSAWKSGEYINKMINNYIKWALQKMYGCPHYTFTFWRLVIWTSFKYQSNFCSRLLVYIVLFSPQTLMRCWLTKKFKWHDASFFHAFFIRTAHVIDFSLVEKRKEKCFHHTVVERRRQRTRTQPHNHTSTVYFVKGVFNHSVGEF